MIKQNDDGQRNAIKIEELTRGQSGNRAWEEEREWRLTASKFGAICKATQRRNMLTLATSILHPPKLKSDAIVHGQAQEENAAKKFTEVTGLDVKKCGLFIDEKYSYLAASPDGIVGEEALLEVKCPFTQRNSKISGSNLHLFPMLEKKDGQLKLKRTHDFFFQIQGQLNICKKKLCHFVIYTFEDIYIEKIEVDGEFYAEKMLPHLSKFWEDHYLPRIVCDLVSKGQS